MKIIQANAVHDDLWTHKADDASPEDFTGTCSGEGITVALSTFTEHRDAVLSCMDTCGIKLGLRIPNTADVRALKDDLDRFALIALDFPAFTDGRAYSQAVILREQLGYRGLLRATGDVLQDQLRHMARCGFDQFALRADKDPKEAINAFSSFTVDYQAPWIKERSTL